LQTTSLLPTNAPVVGAAQKASSQARRTATREPAAASGFDPLQRTTNQSGRPKVKQQVTSAIPTGQPVIRVVAASQRWQAAARTVAPSRDTNQVPAARQQKKEPLSKEAAEEFAWKKAETERQAAAAKEKARREEEAQLAQEADQEKERQKKADAKAAEKEATAAETRREQKNTADAQLDTHGQSSNMSAPGLNSAVVAPKKTMTLKAYTALKKKAKPEKG
jgi:hypothetical protein